MSCRFSIPGRACSTKHRSSCSACSPWREIVGQVRAVHPDVPIIGFPKGAAAHYETYRQQDRSDGLGLDWSVPLSMAKELQREGAVQGNLDPLRLVAGGKALARWRRGHPGERWEMGR